MTKVKSPLKTKLLVSIGSLIFFVVLLEIFLRIVGFILLGREVQQGDTESELLPGAKIMCVGDSFTYGGSLFAEKKTYPVLLQQRLDSSIPESGFRVINKGVCESNTGDLNRSLPGWVDSIKPDIVILLIGAANRFTPWDYEYYRNKGTGSHLKSIIFDLRVVKMARIIWLNLKAREVAGGTRSLRGVLQYTTPDQDYITTNYDAYEADLSKRRKQFDKPEADNPIHMLWYYNNAEKFEEGIKYGLSLRDDNNADEIEAILALADLYYQSDKVKELEALLAAALAEFPKSQKTHNGLSYYYAEIAGRYRQKSRYETAIESYLKAISFDPNEYDNYYWLIKLYDLQSYYDSFDVHSELERMMEANAILSGSKLFTSNLNLYHDKQQWEKDIEQWVHDDLERIAKLCKEKGIKLIIQNYPISYSMANKQLRKIAEEHSLPFVDNLFVFSGLQPRGKYFLDDDHCTVEGHRVMVENIFKVLVEERMVSP